MLQFNVNYGGYLNISGRIWYLKWKYLAMIELHEHVISSHLFDLGRYFAISHVGTIFNFLKIQTC